MEKGRFEAFTDAVIAIIMTIMVLELRPPHFEASSFSQGLEALKPLALPFLGYVLSFVNLGIYWNNHHHMLQVAEKVNGVVLWANLHLLFWLSLVPFTTAWVGESHMASGPVFFYGLDLILAAVTYTLLSRALVAANGGDSAYARALGNDFKGKASIAIYVCGILLAFVFPVISCLLYVLVAVIWFVPDTRFERAKG